ncbi:hypothetical protein MKW98_001221 [Papaver atlanticum]|uniref:Cytochrome P450 n=1 Tax=Papaver atlanticum TaxID=357466 RepID=A0AAD4XK14_9MAGN|nr:hypothetical protein MKW98_001221 [Papaver atlanticum]
MAEQIMKTHDLIFAARPEILAAKILSFDSTGLVFSRYGDYWRHVRKLSVLELFSAKQVQSFISLREAEASNLIQRISSGAGLSINFSQRIFNSSNDIVSRAVYDLYPSQKWLHLISGMKGKLDRIHQKQDKILNDIIEEHKKKKMLMMSKDENDNYGQTYIEEDLVDVLLRVQENSGLEFRLPTDNIKAVILVST